MCRLVALIGLEEIPDIFAEFITEEDLKCIMTAVSCISGTTCLVDFPVHPENLSFIHKDKVSYLTRLSEASLIRTDSDLIRVME